MIVIHLRFFNLRRRKSGAGRPACSAVPLAAFALLLAACGTAGGTQPTAPPEAAAWDRIRIEEILEVLNEGEVELRATGTPGYDLVAEYVADQFAQSMLQPALHNSFLLTYPTPIHRILTADFIFSAGDSLALGVDFLPHARSDSGMVAAALSEESRFSVVPRTAVSDSSLEALRSRGAELVLVEGELAPAQAGTPTDGLLVVQVTPGALALLRKQSGNGELRVSVEADSAPVVTGTNVAGYRAGRHPVLARELVIFCADLDAMGRIAGVPTRDMEWFGTDVAALLELARRSGDVEGGFGAPDRTVLFAALFGGRLKEAGLRAYLRRPLWPLDATRAVVYLGLSPEREARVRPLLAEHGIELHAVRPDEARAREGVVLLPDDRLRQASPVNAGTPRPSFDLSQTIDRVYPEVIRTAEEGRTLLRRLAYTGFDRSGDSTGQQRTSDR